MPLCDLIEKEYHYVLLKLGLGIAFGLFDAGSDMYYYTHIDDVSNYKQLWLGVTIVSILILIVYLSMRVWMVCHYLQPDDFDVGFVPSDRMLRYDSFLLVFDILILVVEDLPQLSLLYMTQRAENNLDNGQFSLSVLMALVSILVSMVIIVFSFVYVLCCCTVGGKLLKLKAMSMFCCCAGNYEKEYVQTRTSLLERIGNHVMQGIETGYVGAKAHVEGQYLLARQNVDDKVNEAWQAKDNLVESVQASGTAVYGVAQSSGTVLYESTYAAARASGDAARSFVSGTAESVASSASEVASAAKSTVSGFLSQWR
eukprot:TRINITY_DN11131_c0_g1_i1.p1 TRINITY_DN11131_c0_g1~~TRINITY_DN11131_c0_g1_i1.p1  ORF type:complete len:313 (+),score=48.64 TRINITY_DN11131_c0_g1_i1:43-981(+)